MDNTREEVKRALEGESEESSTSEENVSSSREVKESTEGESSKDESKEEAPKGESSEGGEAEIDTSKEVEAPKSEKDAEDLKTQIKNLNTALQQERGYSKKKIEEMTQKLEESTSVLEKFKQAFTPPQEKEEEEIPSYATPDDVDRLVEEKLQKIKQEQKQLEKVEEYKKQIKDLETKWDGSEGKPKYDDSEVLNWQKENNKVYLSPEDAFFQMRRNEILDYEVKQRMSNKKSAVEVEKTSSESRDDSKPNEESLANTDTRSVKIYESISK